MSRQRCIWLLSPYHTGSQQAWAEGYAAHSRYAVRILAKEGHFWKWRMQGGALELAQQAGALLAEGARPDLLLATSMVNLPAFLAQLRRQLAGTPVVLYMHENQLTYPPPPGTKRDLTYGMIQHLGMMAADRICFNSAYHMQSWYEELPRLLKHFPDYMHLETIESTRAKSLVLPVGCDLRRFDPYFSPKGGSHPPLILWNQRWEYDKDPGTMLKTLYELQDTGSEFKVALAGESFRVQPGEFVEARERLGSRLVHYGYAAGAEQYARLLWEADIVLSTAVHEFFGISVVEAMYCGCAPVLPNRLSYPELIPAHAHDRHLYHSFGQLLDQLRALLTAPSAGDLHEAVARFDWSLQAPAYDQLMSMTMV
jgi:glycosyltransferase involved in cell wall biosynthesis